MTISYSVSVTFSLGLVVVLSSFNAVSAAKKRNETTIRTRTIGGTEVSEGKYPFVVSVQIFEDKSWTHLCTGVICSDNRIITPAQCVDEFEAWELRLVVGSNRLNETEGEYYMGKTYAVSKIVMHEDYDEDTMTHDISVLHVWGHFHFGLVSRPNPINSDDESNGQVTQSAIGIVLTDTPPDTQCIVLGWSGKGQTQTVLKEAMSRVLDDESCSESYEAVGKTVFSEQQICAKAEGACFDDEGGPLICNGELVGLVSWNFVECGDYPVVHTRIFYYLPWLAKNGCPLCNGVERRQGRPMTKRRGFKEMNENFNEL